MTSTSIPDYSSFLLKIESKLTPQNIPTKKQLVERSLTLDDKKSLEAKAESSVNQGQDRTSSSVGHSKSPAACHPHSQSVTAQSKSPVQHERERVIEFKTSGRSNAVHDKEFRFPGLSGLVADTISGLTKADLIQDRFKNRLGIGLPPAPRSPMDPSSRLGLHSFNTVTPTASILSPQHAAICPPYKHSNDGSQPKPLSLGSKVSSKESLVHNLGALGDTEPMSEFQKDTPASQLVSQTLLPLVMDNVRRCWQQFRKEIVQEVRREFAMCSSIKIQECLEEVQRVQTMVSRNREDCLRAVERRAEEIKRDYQVHHEEIKMAYNSVLDELRSYKDAHRHQSKNNGNLDSSYNKENMMWAMNPKFSPNQSREAFRQLDLNSKESIANASLYIEARRDQENKIKDFLKGFRLKSARNEADIANTFDSKHTLPHNYYLKASLGVPPKTQKQHKEIKLKRSVLDNDCLNITAPTNLEVGGRQNNKSLRRMSIDTTGGRSKSDSREELKGSQGHRSKKAGSSKLNSSGVTSQKRTVIAEHQNSSIGGNYLSNHNASTTTAKSRDRGCKRN